jgi:hypothetical protein
MRFGALVVGAPDGTAQWGRRNPPPAVGQGHGLDWSERAFTVEYRADGSIQSRCEERRQDGRHLTKLVRGPGGCAEGERLLK